MLSGGKKLPWVAIAAAHEGQVCTWDAGELLLCGSGREEAAWLADGIRIRIKAWIQLDCGWVKMHFALEGKIGNRKGAAIIFSYRKPEILLHVVGG